MLIIWIGYILACVYGIQLSHCHMNYLDKEQTNAIKGIFAGIIMFSHFLQYIKLSDSVMDSVFSTSIRSIGQLMVVMFLFYSGYGIVRSAERKRDYFDTFFTHRIIHTLLYFDFAVLIFAIVNLLRGSVFSVKRYLLSLIGWSSIGNSNWFVFAILCAYIIVLIVVKTQNNQINEKSLLMITAGCLLYIFVMRYFKESWWYNTIMTFPAGMYYGYYKSKIDQHLKQKYWLYLAGFLLLFAALNRYKGIVYIYVVYAVLFALIVVLLTYKVNKNWNMITCIILIFI